MSNRICAETRVYRIPLATLAPKLSTVIPMKSPVIRNRRAKSPPRIASSINARDRYGSARPSAVPVVDSRTTGSRAPAYGRT